MSTYRVTLQGRYYGTARDFGSGMAMAEDALRSIGKTPYRRTWNSDTGLGHVESEAVLIGTDIPVAVAGILELP